MPNYYYEAITDSGKRMNGFHRSLSKQAAIHDLRNKGYSIRSIQEKAGSVWNNELTIGKAVKLEDFVVFCRQLATLIRAGIQIDRSLAIMIEQTKAKKLKEGLNQVLEQIRSGNSLSKAMGEHPKIFPEMFINMVASGETGGHLDDVLERMAESYEKENETIQKVRSAMTYPILLIVVAIGVVIFLLIQIVPTFVSLFNDQGEQLPWITRLILGASDFVVNSWWMIGIALAGFALIVRVIMGTEQGKYYADMLKFKLPIFGVVFKKAAIARMARTMSSLYVSGVAIIQSLDITGRVVGNRVLAKVLQESRQSLQQGELLSTPFATSKLFPAMVIQMIMVGEETGQLDKMLAKVADFFEADVNHSVDRLKAVVEPLLLLLISVVVGGIVAAVISPMFAMYQNYLK